MCSNAFFPVHSVSGQRFYAAFVPVSRAKIGGLEELAYDAEALLPPGSDLTILLHGEEVVVVVSIEAYVDELLRKLTRAAEQHEIPLISSTHYKSEVLLPL